MKKKKIGNCRPIKKR